MTVKVDTSPYRTAYGKEPQPKEVGLWTFRMRDGVSQETRNILGSYQEALERVVLSAEAQDCTIVEVLP